MELGLGPTYFAPFRHRNINLEFLFVLLILTCACEGLGYENRRAGGKLAEQVNVKLLPNSSANSSSAPDKGGGVLQWVVGADGVIDRAANFLGHGLDSNISDLRLKAIINDYVQSSNKTSMPTGKQTEENYVQNILKQMDDSDAEKGSGRFNKTVQKQEAFLETVARVRQRKTPSNSTAAPTIAAADGLLDHLANAGTGEKHDGALLAQVSARLGGRAELPGKPGDDRLQEAHARQESNDQAQNKKGQGVGGGRVDPGSEQVAGVEGARHEEAHGGAEAESVADAAQDEGGGNAAEDGKEDVMRLIDSQDNEYVISNPGKGLNQMQLQQDLTLISDIVKVIVLAAVGGLICGILGQPVILGYLLAGMIAGPGGLALVHELVQVETLAQFGVVFLLFALGVEFSLAKMQGVHSVALGGGALQIAFAMLLGGLLGTTPTVGVFVGAFLSMSSTTVVVKCLMDTNSVATEHGQIILGTLILQDCALGLLLAIMPALGASGTSPLAIFRALGREGVMLLAFVAVAWLLSRLFVPRFLRLLTTLALHNGELYQLGVVAVCLCGALVSEFLGLSLEVGAFVAGLMLSGNVHSEQTLHQVEPVRNLFAALFLASVGMVMHPVFLWQHIHILLTATMVVFFGKIVLATVVVKIFGYSWGTGLSVGIALAQIGEFSFVLLSRAQTLGMVSRSLYLLLMGTTALSLVLTPFAFKVVKFIIPPDGQVRRGGPLKQNGSGRRKTPLDGGQEGEPVLPVSSPSLHQGRIVASQHQPVGMRGIEAGWEVTGDVEKEESNRDRGKDLTHSLSIPGKLHRKGFLLAKTSSTHYA